MAIRSANINVMMKAAEKAGRALVRDFGEVEQLQVSRKGPADFVSNADVKAEKIILRELEKARPDFGFLMEEGGAAGPEDAEARFIIDPLDGTTNFLHGLPHWAISIGLEMRGEITAGVIYDPVKDEMFWGEKGQGAFLRDRRLRVSSRRQVSDSVFATGIPHLGIGGGPEGHAQFLKRLERVMAHSAGLRRWGTASLDLAYVAAGRYDGFWERGLNAWDVAAGIIIVKEAGGFVTDLSGRNYAFGAQEIVACNDGIQRGFLDLLRGK
ncbi:MAG: inositol monophosphatase family protein [Alphaproteobacteria bacterium]